MAEALRKGNGATAADCGFGNQRVKPTELLTLSQLVNVEDQLGVAADDLEAAQGLEENIDLLIREGWLEIAAGP